MSELKELFGEALNSRDGRLHADVLLEIGEVENIFCATGARGGVDATCKKGEGLPPAKYKSGGDAPAISLLKPAEVKAAKEKGWLKSGVDIIDYDRAKLIKDSLAGKKNALTMLTALHFEESPPASSPIDKLMTREIERKANIQPFKNGQQLTRAAIRERLSKVLEFDKKAEMDKIMNEVAKSVGDVKIHGMTEAESMKGMKIDGVHFEWSEKATGVNASLRNILEEIPEKLWAANRTVTFCSQQNVEDKKWKVQYNDPNHISAATAGDGNICVYNRSIDSGIFAHESGHNLAAKIWGNTTPKASSDYGKAQQLSGPVSRYGGNSPSEDFAEACRMYSSTLPSNGPFPTPKDNLRDNHPAKYAVIKSMLE